MALVGAYQTSFIFIYSKLTVVGND